MELLPPILHVAPSMTVLPFYMCLSRALGRHKMAIVINDRDESLGCYIAFEEVLVMRGTWAAHRCADEFAVALGGIRNAKGDMPVDCGLKLADIALSAQRHRVRCNFDARIMVEYRVSSRAGCCSSRIATHG